jgi:DnaJ-class molecular chaperone
MESYYLFVHYWFRMISFSVREIGSMAIDFEFTILLNPESNLSVRMTMKKHGSERVGDKEKEPMCRYCKGTGRDLSRSLWGEFVCPVCGGTGKRTTKRVQTPQF